MVRVKRLELSHLAIPEPKSGASTNSAKPALHPSFLRDLYSHILRYRNLLSIKKWRVIVSQFRQTRITFKVLKSLELSHLVIPEPTLYKKKWRVIVSQFRQTRITFKVLKRLELLHLVNPDPPL